MTLSRTDPNKTDQIPADPTKSLRWGVYALLAAISIGNMGGRLMAVNSVDRVGVEKHRISQRLDAKRKEFEEKGLEGDRLEGRLDRERDRLQKILKMQRPLLSANDRSRWLAVRALVEKGTYEIDDLIEEPTWDTIDMVRHRGRDGELHFYSSKPPLLMTLIAGEYWLIHHFTGMTLSDHPYLLDRLMLVTINIFPLVLMFILLARLVERYGTTDWGRIFVMAAATLGTLLVPFAVVLNNHLLGAVFAAVTLYGVVRSGDTIQQGKGGRGRAGEEDGDRSDGAGSFRTYAMTGFAAAMTAACELPALALLALVASVLWMRNRRMWFLAFLPAASLVATLFFATNYAAHNSLRPPYMHRSTTDAEDDWYRYTYMKDGRERDSYWMDPQGIDGGEPSRMTYALHVLVGHHGILSLTPMWLLSCWGLWLWLLRDGKLPHSRPPGAPDAGGKGQRQLALGIGLLTLVCLVFFLGLRPQGDRNYGGMTSGFRWMFWFAPLWLLVMLPAADRAARSRFGRAFALVLLAMSVFSASYPTWNPWRQPWIYNLMEYCGWQGF